MSSPEERIVERGITLPKPPTPKGAYLPAKQVGSLVYTAGMSAIKDGVRQYVGRVGSDVSLDEAYQSARWATVNCLAAVRSVLGSLDVVTDVVRVTGYIRSATGFDQQPVVLDGASDLLAEVFADRGTHARSAIGVTELPFGISVEIELIVITHDPGGMELGQERS